MKIIVVGCGKIGSAVIRSLVEEGHDVVAVDIDQEVVETIGDRMDVMTVCGNGVDYDTLSEAGAEDARLIIAATPVDETNILCCFLARRMGTHHSVARIESTDASERELSFIKQQMNISMFLNPAQLVAGELLNMLKLPSGIKAEYFARRSFEMIEFKVSEGSGLDGLSLIELRQKKFKERFLICVVKRGDEVIVTRDGNFVLKNGDRLMLNASPKVIDRLLREMGYIPKDSRSVMLLGGSHTAFHLSHMLTESGANLKIVEIDRQRCRELCEAFPKAVVINADGAHGEVLGEEGLTSCDAFVALTGLDEQNILMAIYASKQNVPKAFAKVDRAEFSALAGELGLDGQVVPTEHVSNVIVRYARAIENSVGNNVETLYKLLGGMAEAVEFNVRPGFKYADMPLVDLNPLMKPGILIGGIVRGNRSIIPSGDDVIKPGDRVIIVVSGHQLLDLSDIFLRA